MSQSEQQIGDVRAAFTAFVDDVEPRLRRALAAGYGLEAGRDAAADALAYAWEHWDRIKAMDNPGGYIYRVGQTKARKALRWRSGFATANDNTMPWVEPGLIDALSSLTRRQRVAVILVHGFGMTHRETAELTGLSRSTIQNHVERGLTKLQIALGGTNDD
ncbi:MAG TPA: hypothetical protein ENH15_06395 [Actinobacteria bacterium]|nr:hypothetical protein [Actinomycetota bacterium]